MPFLRRFSLKRTTAHTGCDGDEVASQTSSAESSTRKPFGFKWFGRSKASKRPSPEHPRPSTPTPYLMLGGRKPGTRQTHSTCSDDDRQTLQDEDHDDLYDDDDDDDAHLSVSERERLSCFASGVRGLIAALQAADETARANPPTTHDAGTPLSPIFEADELSDDDTATAAFPCYASLSETEVDSFRTVTELDFGDLPEEDQKHPWGCEDAVDDALIEAELSMDLSAGLSGHSASHDAESSNLALRGLDLAVKSLDPSEPKTSSLRARLFSLPAENAPTLRDIFPVLYPDASELESKNALLVSKVEELEQEKARLELALTGAQRRLTDQDMHLVSLTAQILSLRNAMAEKPGNPNVVDAAPSPSTSNILVHPSPDKSLALSTPPATPERTIFPFSFSPSPRNDLDTPHDLFFELDSMESFRLPQTLTEPTKERRLMRRRSAGAATSLAGPVDGRVQVKRRAGSADLRTLCITPLQLQE